MRTASPRQLWSRALQGVFVLAAALLLAAGSPQRAGAVQFGSLTDLVTGIGFTTVLTLGPEDPDPGSNADGCIYGVHGSNGTVHRVCFDASKSITSNDVVIDLNGGGGVNNVLGITIDPDSDPAGEIHLYLGYSPDNGAPFQGRVARAVSTNGGSSYTVDETFITGLARSAFDHQTDAVYFGPDNCLYINQGNNSNAGYDTDHAESRLSSAILRACFKAPDGSVDPGFDRNCGGGNSQEACDVEVYASGLRHPYDSVWHSNGKLYNADNDANDGFRDSCGGQANDFGCPCQTLSADPLGDELNLIEQDMYYGSPNPYRAMPSGLQCNGGTDGGDSCTTSANCGGGGSCVDLSALCTDGVCGDVVQCYYFGDGAPPPTGGQDPNGIYRTPIAQIGALMDGITEYRALFDGRTSSSFCSDWNGDLLVAGGPGSVRRFSLSADGTAATHEGTGNLNGATGLDVVVGHDGTIYTADLNAGKITYLLPQTQSNPAAANYFVQSCAAGDVCTDGACEADSDNDGLGDSVDPCSADPLNRCAGSVVTDGTSGLPIRINTSTGADSCAGTKVDCNGDTWYADFGYNQSASSFVCNLGGGCAVNTTPLFGCTDANTEDLFQCEHYDLPDLPELQYSFDVPDGDYLVNLLFMNAYTGTAAVGDRLFDILIEGATVYAGFDQVEAAGGSGIPVVRSALVTVSDGNGLQIQLAHQLPENPNIKGIEVLGVNVPSECTIDPDCDDSNACTDDTCNAGFCVFTPNTDPCDDGVACTSPDVCSGGVCSGTDSCTGGDICNTGTGLCETPGLAIRINVNGAQHTGTDFPGTWLADPGSGGVCGPSAYSTSDPINNTVDDALFQGEAYGTPMTCAIDDGGNALPAGDYTVNILFAEIYHGPGCPGSGGVGARVFDVALEGTTVETGIDIFSEVGCAASTTDPSTNVIVRSYPNVNIVDGVLDVSMPATADNAKISAIEVLLQGGGCITNGDCDDSDVCTDDVCNAGTCQYTNNTDPCDDGVACTSGDVCGGGTCAGADSCTGGQTCNLVSGVCEGGGCITNGDCDDSDVCTDDVCNAGSCEYTNNTDPCDDGVACTSGDVCGGGTCAGADSCAGGQTCNLVSGVCEGGASFERRINVNGSAHVGSDYPGSWEADVGVGGVCGDNVSSNANPIHNTVDDPLFTGEVWGNPVTCAIDDSGQPLPAGDYDVTLYFAEIYFGDGCPGGGSGTGARVFDVALEGATVETGIDLFSEAGCAASTTVSTGTPVVRSYTTTVSDGTLDISLPASVNNGKISAIELVLQGGGGGCVTNPECDDSDLCTTDVCNAGTCENTFDPLVCTDTFPADDDFEADFGSWTNVGGDDFDWTRLSGATPSNNTGPSGDHTTGSGFYLYTEASSPNNPNMTALLEGRCIELAGMAQARLDFWYHMYGSNMGSLSVDAAAGCGTTWTEDLWVLSGDQGDQWFGANVDLTAYAGSRVRLRFEGVTGSNLQSDMAIDDVSVDASSTPPSSVPTDIQMPGTQPGELANDVEQAGNCSLCHQGYSGGNPMAEPQHGWGGSMMAHASRDPLFWGAMAVAEQNFAGSGDLCLRCHVPKGWLAGRSEPTDGSALLDSDADGVQCDLCHRLTNPDNTEHLGVQNSPFIANDGGAPATAFVGAGQYVIWDQTSKLGPYDDASAPHGWLQSNLHRSEDACGTCHDVSNPLTGDLAHNNGAQIPLAPGQFSDVPGGPVAAKAAFLNFPHQYGVVERTYSEAKSSLLSQTLISDFDTLPEELQAGAIQAAYDAAILAGQGGDYADGTARTFSCQACHMRATSGEGCSQFPGVRDDLPTHDLTGANYWMPDALEYLDGLGQLRLGGGLSATQLAQLDAGQIRAQQMLSDAASLQVTGDVVKVINLTGHKLITGYPEGRRMWLNIQYFDALDVMIDEVGAYGQITADIDGQPTQVETLLDPGDPDLRRYEVHNAITQEWANELIGLGVSTNMALTYDRETGAVTNTLGDLAAQAPGTWLETNHFVLNNFTAGDTRIPPFGMAYDAAAARNALPVPASQYGNPGAGGTYDYWDEVQLNPPPAAVRADITLYYQPTSWEYVQFLDLGNDGSNTFLALEGERVLDAWLNTGMAAPYAMTSTTWTVSTVCGDGTLDAGEDCDNGAGNGTPGQCCSATCSFELAATECRASTDTCDVAEQCSGSSGVCPADGFASAGTSCRASAGVCDVAEQCTGSGASCPADGFVAGGTECRATAGACDVAEQCTGSGAACPADGFVPGGTQCRGVAGVCDVAEQCTGSGAACPADGFVPGGTECRAAVDGCDVAEDCTGSGSACPADGFASSSTPCDDSVACTENETCDGAGACDPGTPNDGLCDDTLFCNGAETCDQLLDCQAGTPPPGDAVPCTDDVCDEVLDIVVSTPNDTNCDDTLFCNGDETCDALLDCQPGTPPELVEDGVSCTVATCDEVNDRIEQVPDDSYCVDADLCDGSEWCNAIFDCQPALEPLDCDDGEACTADSCDALTGCAHAPIGGCLVAVPSASPGARLLLVMLMAGPGWILLRAARRRS